MLKHYPPIKWFELLLLNPVWFTLVCVTCFSATAVFMVFLLRSDTERIEQSIELVAKERGRALFGLVELAREWNAQHGGVYVPLTANDVPNPYLKHPKRDVTTQDGTQLTMINPAYMTRQMAEIAEQRTGIKLHITSSNPIRPANAPDAWESESLSMFEQGTKDRLSFFQSHSDQPIYRFMAPLWVKQPCLKCHEAQGYKLGDIRGGISVSMPADSLLDVRTKQMQAIKDRYLSVYLLVNLLLLASLWMLRRYVRNTRIHKSLLESRINERTVELKENIAHLKDLNRQLKENDETLNCILETTKDGFWRVGADGRLVNVNDVYCRMSGYSREELLRMTISDLEADEAPVDVQEHIDRVLSTGGDLFETEHRRRDGSVWPVEVSVSYQDTGGGHFLVFIRDISERKSHEDQVRKQAFYDPLTSLPNRRLLSERINQAMMSSKQSKSYGALMFIDLDNFKPLNDLYGHKLGDILLIEVAKRLLECVRNTDTVARVGGDEFVVLTNQLGNDHSSAVSHAETLANKICAALGTVYALQDNEQTTPAELVHHHCTATIGVTVFMGDTLEADTLLVEADRAMYQAKRKGRNRVELAG